MKNFIKLIQQKDKKITASYINKELEKFENIMGDLEREHQQIIKDTLSINYLLDLIEKHQIDDSNVKVDTTKKTKNWIHKMIDDFEKFHLKEREELTMKDLEYLKTETSKLKHKKQRLKKEHKNLHILIAKTSVMLMDARQTACIELSKGHSIASISEKLKDHFGKKIEDDYSYNSGKRKMLRFLEKTFLINRIQSKGIFDILEKTKVIKFKVEMPKNNVLFQYPNMDSFDTEFIPLVNNWYINA